MGEEVGQPPGNGNSAESREVVETVKAVQKVESVLEQLPPQQQQAAIAVLATRTESFTGPIPHPLTLAQYEQVLPGAAERLLALYERGEAHRIDRETRIITGRLSLSKRGQWMGGVIAVVCIAAGMYLALNGHPDVAKVLFGGTLAALVAVFVTGSISSKPATKKTDKASE